ncbi:MAG: arginine repressor [Acidobacteria bacterium]|nr:arginine repressor [Acidobacteriota bacterium]
MITKKARHGRILELTSKREVRSQEELASLLQREGIDVTQSTLSRDIRELGLVKVRGCYRVSGELNSVPAGDNLRRAFEQYVLKTGVSGNMLMIRTTPGNAHSIGVVLDAVQWPEVLGTVAGDDTVFVLLRNGHSGRKVMARIRELSA